MFPRALSPLFLVLFFLSSPVFAEEAAPAYGDALVSASIAEPSNLIPYLATDTASAGVSSLVHNGLLKYDKDLKLVGDLASSWEVLDGGLRIIFHLRPGVVWHDRRLFTAADVEFTYKQLIDPATPTPYASNFQKVESLKVVDPLTLEVRYREPFSPGLASWTMGIVPAHRRPSAREPVGTGPYRLKKWRPGRLELVANPDYFEGRPLVGRQVLRVIPDASTLFLELLTENVDEAGLTPLQFMRQTDGAFFRGHYRKFRYPSFGYTYLGFNLANPFFADKRVRKAIGLAIDKERIVEVSLLGTGRVATGPFLPGSWAHDPAVRPGAYDPAAARRLLAEAGWAGRRPSFTVLLNQGNAERRMAAEMIQKNLSDVGIEMRIRTLEWGTLLKEFVDKKNFEAVLLGWSLGQDPDIYEIFHSSQAAPGHFNFVSYNNPEVDRLLEEARRLFDEDQRAQRYRRVHAILAEDEPYCFLYVPDALLAVHRRFRGPEAAPAGIGHNLIRWFVPKDEQRYA